MRVWRVTVKPFKLGMDTKQVIARFEAERQALALMDHPNIAKVLDAGATETGRPYFVMELVRGQRITEYCDENSLDTEARLGLFMQVCHAIQHAHQKGIIHRDINFGERLRRQSNYAEAEPMFREALAMRRKLDGDENPSLASPLFHLGLVLQEQGKLSEAEAQFREALAKQPLGNDYPFASTLLSGLAKVLRAQGKPDQVEGMYHEWLRNLRSRASVSELQIGAVLAEVTLKLLNEKKFAEAGQFDKAVAVQKEAIALLQDERSRQDYASRLKLYESNKPCRVSG